MLSNSFSWLPSPRTICRAFSLINLLKKMWIMNNDVEIGVGDEDGLDHILFCPHPRILVCLPKSNLSVKQSVTNPQSAQDERIRQQWNEMTGWLVCNNADCLQYWLFAQICANITWQRGSERGDRGLSQEWVTRGTLLKHKQTLTGRHSSFWVS